MAKHRESHLAQTLRSMRSAQDRLQTVSRMDRLIRVESAAGGNPDPTGILRRSIRNGYEVQGEELAMAARCLRTMYPAANEPAFEVAL